MMMKKAMKETVLIRLNMSNAIFDKTNLMFSVLVLFSLNILWTLFAFNITCYTAQKIKFFINVISIWIFLLCHKNCHKKDTTFQIFFSFSNGFVNIALVKMKHTNLCIVNIKCISSSFPEVSWNALQLHLSPARPFREAKKKKKTIAVFDLIIFSTLKCILLHLGTQK